MRESIAGATYTDLLQTVTRAAEEGERGEFLEELWHLRTAATTVDIATRTAVTTARANGATWADIGLALGTTRQGAYQRYGQDS